MHETFNYAGNDTLNAGRVINTQFGAVGAEYTERFGKPDFRACFSQDPVDDRLFRFRGARFTFGIGTDIVFAPDLTVLVG